MESHGRINSGPHSSSLSPAGSSGRFESVIKGYSRTLCQIMEAGKCAPHTQTPPRSATGQIPAFHLAALPWISRWSRWSRLYGVCVPGAAQPSRWLLWTIWVGYTIQFAQRPPKFRGIHLTAVKAADAHVLWGNHCPTGEGRNETGPSSWYEGRVFQSLHHCAQEKRWVTTNLGSAHLELGLS